MIRTILGFTEEKFKCFEELLARAKSVEEAREV
jgi:hypothetical protein